MANLDLRPLSLGEILDRTFSIYRRNFLLFLGITALPNLLVLALNLVQTMMTQIPVGPPPSPGQQLQARPASGPLAFGIVGLFVGLFVYLVAYLFAQCGTVYAVSELYLGRQTSIGASLRRMLVQLVSLFGVILLNALAVMAATLFLIIPGIYRAFRLLTSVPATLLVDL